MGIEDYLFLDEESSSDDRRHGAITDIFAEEPVDLTTFVTDAGYLDNPPLSMVQYEAVRHIERIYYAQTYKDLGKHIGGALGAYWSEPIRMTNLITLQWGKGSGKDHICRVASMRIAYLLLCLKSPQTYFGKPRQDTITMLNIAASATQAEDAYFRPMVRAINSSVWFKDKAEPKQGFIAYDKNIEAKSGHSDSESQEGGNLILAVADEIDAFRSKEELERYRGKAVRDSPRAAESILRMLQTSASTRFPETYKNVRISYPRYLGSTIQKLTKRGREDNERNPRTSRHYVSGPLATWDVNPGVKDKSAFADDYIEDPEMARAMYECKPSRASDQYFRNMPAIRAAVDKMEQPIQVDYQTRRIRAQLTGEMVEGWEPIFTFSPDFQPKPGAIYAVHCDLAVKGDRAGIAMSHVARYIEQHNAVMDEHGAAEDTEIVSLPFVVNDFCFSFSADSRVTPAREIQIGWALNLIFELRRRGFKVQRVTYDQFQSTHSMQLLEQQGIETDRVSTDLNEDVYKTFRDVAYEGRLSMPYNDRALDELEALSRIAGKIDHPPGGSKDEADALTGSVMGAIVAGGRESDGPLDDELDEDEESEFSAYTGFNFMGEEDLYTGQLAGYEYDSSAFRY